MSLREVLSSLPNSGKAVIDALQGRDEAEEEKEETVLDILDFDSGDSSASSVPQPYGRFQSVLSSTPSASSSSTILVRERQNNGPHKRWVCLSMNDQERKKIARGTTPCIEFRVNPSDKHHDSHLTLDDSFESKAKCQTHCTPVTDATLLGQGHWYPSASYYHVITKPKRFFVVFDKPDLHAPPPLQVGEGKEAQLEGVYGAVSKLKGTSEVLIKSFKDMMGKAENIRSFIKEVAVLRSMDHPNIVKILGVVYTPRPTAWKSTSINPFIDMLHSSSDLKIDFSMPSALPRISADSVVESKAPIDLTKKPSVAIVSRPVQDNERVHSVSKSSEKEEKKEEEKEDDSAPAWWMSNFNEWTHYGSHWYHTSASLHTKHKKVTHKTEEKEKTKKHAKPQTEEKKKPVKHKTEEKKKHHKKKHHDYQFVDRLNMDGKSPMFGETFRDSTPAYIMPSGCCSLEKWWFDGDVTKMRIIAKDAQLNPHAPNRCVTRYTFPELLNIFWYQLLTGLVYFHRHRTGHCDLKPANLVVLSEANAFPLIMIVDPGISVLDLNQKRAKFHETSIVSFWWRPPEVDINAFIGNYNTKVDIYSMGIIFLDMMLGEYTFGTCVDEAETEHMRTVYFHDNGKMKQPLIDRIKMKLYNVDDPNMIDLSDDILEMCSLIEVMVRTDPEERPAAIELLDHPLFTENKGLFDNASFYRPQDRLLDEKSLQQWLVGDASKYPMGRTFAIHRQVTFVQMEQTFLSREAKPSGWPTNIQVWSAEEKKIVIVQNVNQDRLTCVNEIINVFLKFKIHDLNAIVASILYLDLFMSRQKVHMGYRADIVTAACAYLAVCMYLSDVTKIDNFCKCLWDRDNSEGVTPDSSEDEIRFIVNEHEKPFDRDILLVYEALYDLFHVLEYDFDLPNIGSVIEFYWTKETSLFEEKDDEAQKVLTTVWKLLRNETLVTSYLPTRLGLACILHARNVPLHTRDPLFFQDDDWLEIRQLIASL